MQNNILSYILTGYALYSVISNKNALQEQLQRIIDLEGGQSDLSEKVEELTTKTYNLLDESIIADYSLVFGRPTSRSKLSASLHFTIRNLSKTNTYIVKGIMFTPIIGTTICNTPTQKLFNLYWKTGVRIAPSMSVNFRMSYNNLKLPADVYNIVSSYLLEQFRTAEGWEKLGDKYATISGGCMSDVWIVANAPYIDAAHDYIITRREVEGNLEWHGGNYLPGNTGNDNNSAVETKYGTILNYAGAKELFRIQ